jgi:TldD protein
LPSGRREVGSSGGGGRFGFNYFRRRADFEYADDAVNAALTNLERAPHQPVK